jgi:hypothetical protein
MSYKAGDKVWVTVATGHRVLPAGDLPGTVIGLITQPRHYYPKYNFNTWYYVGIEGEYQGGPFGCPDPILKPRDDDGNRARDSFGAKVRLAWRLAVGFCLGYWVGMILLWLISCISGLPHGGR